MKNLQSLLFQKGFNVTIDGVIGPKTLEATQNYISQEITKRNWKQPTKGFVFIRLDQNLTNTFDDICVRYNNGKIDNITPCTTTPGHYYVFNPITSGGITGAAVAKEQQVLGSHKFVSNSNWKSLWLGAPYFQQIKPIIVYRDGNKDTKVDKINTQTGLFGINFHRGGLGSIVDRWSAGCQVIPDTYWFKMIDIFTNGESIDYTMFEA
jgi:hypothetical protein